MTTTETHPDPMWPPRCDCCDTALCAASFPGPVYEHRFGTGLYCEPCLLALDRWHGGWGSPARGLPMRCPGHLSAHRLREINADVAGQVSSPETATAVLQYLRDHPTASLRSIAGALGIGRNTAHTAIRRLRRDRLISVDRLGTGHKYPTHYALTPAGAASGTGHDPSPVT